MIPKRSHTFQDTMHWQKRLLETHLDRQVSLDPSGKGNFWIAHYSLHNPLCNSEVDSYLLNVGDASFVPTYEVTNLSFVVFSPPLEALAGSEAINEILALIGSLDFDCRLFFTQKSHTWSDVVVLSMVWPKSISTPDLQPFYPGSTITYSLSL